ncbi:hypothetical protein RJ640_030592 [Escallonia rubra]|uniref:Uncharacterized protein n=1 Tax=Escallonia rubra TaxID=112253 RepID=A0AA88R876_9ASTE|nr:hypothetical protein RJ640_030592 [Escallonia rubra]
MQREERRAKFHDSLLNMLYPPPPHHHHHERTDNKPLTTLPDNLDLEYIPDGLEERDSSSSSSDEEGECGSEKLTRAQRKRLRKKKLKEAASQRRRIIGPVLPTANDDGDGEGAQVDSSCPQDVRRNADKELDVGTDEPEKLVSCMSRKKLKHRRVAKALANERSKSSTVKSCNQGSRPSGDNESLTH